MTGFRNFGNFLTEAYASVAPSWTFGPKASWQYEQEAWISFLMTQLDHLRRNVGDRVNGRQSSFRVLYDTGTEQQKLAIPSSPTTLLQVLHTSVWIEGWQRYESPAFGPGPLGTANVSS
jgi:hypothetical protein